MPHAPSRNKQFSTYLGGHLGIADIIPVKTCQRSVVRSALLVSHDCQTQLPYNLLDSASLRMSTPYPSNSQSLSSTQSHHQSDSSLTSSVNSSAGHLEHDLYEISSSAQHIDPSLSYESEPTDEPRPLKRLPIPIFDPEIRLARLRYESRNDLVIKPQSPPHRDDFPGKPAEGDPSHPENSESEQLDNPCWNNEEYQRYLAAVMSRRFPPDLMGAAEARKRSERGAAAAAPPQRLEGFRQTLDLLKEIKRGNRAEFEAWNRDRGVLEKALADKAANLRAEHALHTEKIHQAHHARRHGRVTDDFYRGAKRHHLHEMRQTMRAVHDVAVAMGILYAERAAVAQGCVPRHGENWGKLDLVRTCILMEAEPTLTTHTPLSIL